MKKIMFWVMSFLVFGVPAAAQGFDTDEELLSTDALESFMEVNVNVPARIRMVHSEDYGIRVSTASVFDSQAIDYEVRNGVLYISTESSGMLNSQGRGTVIYVFTPNAHTSISLGEDVSYKSKSN